MVTVSDREWVIRLVFVFGGVVVKVLELRTPLKVIVSDPVVVYVPERVIEACAERD